MGVRAYPQVQEGQSIPGFFGLDVAVENYVQSFAGTGEVAVPGKMQWVRRDIRMVAAEWRVHRAYSIGGHVAVGHSHRRKHGVWIRFESALGQPAMPRMIGLEFLRWF